MKNINGIKKAIDNIVSRHTKQIEQGQQVSLVQLQERLRGVQFVAIEILSSSKELEEVNNYIFKALTYNAE